jgi:acetolactate synthase-1/2/3 large subunit
MICLATDRLVDSRKRTSEAIVQVLEDAGVDAVFGMVGGDIWMVFDALRDRQSAIRTVAVREESVAGMMAEAYGRLTGRPGVVVGQGAFVVANALMGALEAKLSSSPMLLLADYTDGAPFQDHGPYQSGAAGYGAWDTRKALEAVTKATLSADRPAQAVQAVQFGLKKALSGAPGPVAVLLHRSALRGHVDPDSTPTLYATGPYLAGRPAAGDPQQVRALTAQLAGASRPVIIAGGGVRLAQGYAQLQQLAETLQIGVATTSGGKGVFAETHELALGVVGTYGTPLANELVGDADVILVLGSKLSPADTANENPDLIDPGRQVILQVDIDETNASWTMPADCVVIGDVAVVCDQVTKELAGLDQEQPDRTGAGRLQRIRAARERLGWFDVPKSQSGELPLVSERIVKTLQECLPEQAIVSCDAGENRLFMLRHFQTKAAGMYLQPAGVGGMGYAVPAALAARLAHPDRPVVAVCGDGGFAMSLQALMTSYEQDLPVIVVVLNNSALGWVYHGQGDRRIASEFRDFNYAEVAKSLHCAGHRVQTAQELASAIDAALREPGPTVIDVVTSRDGSSFLDLTSPLAAAGRPDRATSPTGTGGLTSATATATEQS